MSQPQTRGHLTLNKDIPIQQTIKQSGLKIAFMGSAQKSSLL